MELPVVFQYQQALDEFRTAGEASPLLKRMSELISLLDLTTTLSSTLSRAEILDAALLIVLGELRAQRGCLLVQDGPATYEVRAARGLPAGAPETVSLPELDPTRLVGVAEGGHRDVFAALGIDVLCPVARGGSVIAVFGLGRSADGALFEPAGCGFLRSVAACAATPIENGLIHRELKEVNQRLSLKVFQLRNLFDISRELAGSFDEGSIRQLVTSTLMGQMMVSRCALFLRGSAGMAVAHERGIPAVRGLALSEAECAPLAGLDAPVDVALLAAGPLRDRFQGLRVSLLIPLTAGDRLAGFLAAGERLSGAPFDEEDRDFAQTLARQAIAALETVRLHQVQIEKQRQDREMQIARDIQLSLFPKQRPHVPGYEIAAVSESCHQVGGDHYDYIPLPGGRIALAIADVSGKGAPASILMASVHASLRAMAGSASPADLMTRLNRFLFDSTQANRYVTMFYAELDPACGRLLYVNAGHIPPYLVRASGAERLLEGGPVVGLLEDVTFVNGEVTIGPGELLAMVTDGVTEAASSDDEEFGDDRVIAELGRARAGGLGAEDALETLLQRVREYVGAATCADDQTALVLRALPRGTA